MTSSSPSPSPVRLSPVCCTEPSGLVRLLKKMKWLSDRILPSALSINALASRSKSAPVVVRTSQPRPTAMALRPGASLLSETLPPLDRLTLIVGLLVRCKDNSRVPREVPAMASDVHAEVAGDARQARAVALADRAELPLRAVAVELTEDHRRFGGRVLGQVVARDLTVVAGVDD